MKRLDVDEDFMTALGGFDEAEAAVVVPGFEGSGEPHREWGATEPDVQGHIALMTEQQTVTPINSYTHLNGER